MPNLPLYINSTKNIFQKIAHFLSLIPIQNLLGNKPNGPGSTQGPVCMVATTTRPFFFLSHFHFFDL